MELSLQNAGAFCSSAAQEMQDGWGISHGKELMSAESKLSIKGRGSGRNRQHFCGRLKAGKSFLLDNCLINQSRRTKGLKTEIFLTPLHCYSRWCMTWAISLSAESLRRWCWWSCAAHIIMQMGGFFFEGGTTEKPNCQTKPQAAKSQL